MQNRRGMVVALVAFLSLVAGDARAQGGTVDSQCRKGSVAELATQDACQKAIDIFAFMAPQLGASVVGGNAVLGEARALGRPGHFSVGIRANVIRGRLPRVSDISPALLGAVASDYDVNDQILGLPALDVALGVFPGVDVGPVRVLALDLLANVAYVPEVTKSDISIKLPDGSVKVGFGGRLGVVQEGTLIPAVSVSYLKRDLPTVDVIATPNDDKLSLTDFSVRTHEWRAVVGKSLGPITIAAGGGKDSYSSATTAVVTVNQGGLSFTSAPVAVSQRLDRNSIFADLSLNLPLIKLAFEVGQVSGGSIATYNTFGDKRADDGLTYGSVGLRLRW